VTVWLMSDGELTRLEVLRDLDQKRLTTQAAARLLRLEQLWRRLQPLAITEMPLEVPPPRSSRFGSPLVLSRVHWVRPELVAEVKFLAWTEDSLLPQVVYEGLREDKSAAEVRRPVPKQM